MKLTGPSIQKSERVDESSHIKEVPLSSMDSSIDEETLKAQDTNHVLNNDVLVPTVKDAKVHVEFVEPQTFKGIQPPPFGGRNILDINGEKQKGIELK